MPEPKTYSPAQKTLHWLTVVLIAIQVPVGLSMVNLMANGPVKNASFELHKSFGLIVLSLALARVALRVARGAPPLVPGLHVLQRMAAHGSHYALYVLIVLVPLVGWAATSSCCGPVNLFWTIPVTLPVDFGEDGTKLAFFIHFGLAFALVGIAAVHAGAALYHHFIRRDETLVRMLPDLKPDEV